VRDGVLERLQRYFSVENLGRPVATAVPMVWLLLFFLVPFLIVLKISFSEALMAMPPYAPMIEWTQERMLAIKLHLANYHFLFTDPLYLDSFLYSIKVAALSTFMCLLLGYPMALAIARAEPARRSLLLMLVILPFWTSFLLRIYAWIGLLKDDGLINSLLLSLHLIHMPIQMANTSFAVYIGIVYSYLPFMILPLYANLEKHDATLLEAAADLGAPPWKAFLRITLPLSVPGVVAGAMLVFIPAVGEYVIPTLLGSANQLMIGRVLSDEFFENRDWPVASAVAIVILIVLLGPILIFQRYRSRELGAQG
jgi:putrescine transport system permease protein